MPNRPSKNETEREKEWAKSLERTRQRNFRSDGNASFEDAAPTQPVSDGNWSAQLERGRMRNLALQGGLALPGPGAAAATATAPAIGKPLTMPSAGGNAPKEGGGNSFLEAQTPSSLETAKVAAQVASGVGLGKLAAEELKQIGTAAAKGVLAAASATWSVFNKYGLWFLFFGVFSLMFEDPFFTTPALLLLIWVWAVAAHWWPRPKWLRKLNVLEWLILIDITAIYAVAVVLILILIAAVVCALDTSCALEMVQSFGLSDAMSLIQ